TVMPPSRNDYINLTNPWPDQLNNSFDRKRREIQSQVTKEAQNAQWDDAGVAAANASPRYGRAQLQNRKGGGVSLVEVRLSPMVPLWASTGDAQDRLLVVRVVQVADREVCQGIVLDWARLEGDLRGVIADLFPDAQLLPVGEDGGAERPAWTMTVLPVRLD